MNMTGMASVRAEAIRAGRVRFHTRSAGRGGPGLADRSAVVISRQCGGAPDSRVAVRSCGTRQARKTPPPLHECGREVDSRFRCPGYVV